MLTESLGRTYNRGVIIVKFYSTLRRNVRLSCKAGLAFFAQKQQNMFLKLHDLLKRMKCNPIYIILMQLGSFKTMSESKHG